MIKKRTLFYRSIEEIKMKKGQSTLEYVVVFIVIVLGIAGAAYTTLRPALEKVIDNSAARMGKATDTFLSSTTTTRISRRTPPSATSDTSTSDTSTGGTSSGGTAGDLQVLRYY